MRLRIPSGSRCHPDLCVALTNHSSQCRRQSSASHASASPAALAAAYSGFRSKQTQDTSAAPWRPGSRSISRSSDRSTEPANGLGPLGSRSLRQEHRQHTLRPPPRRKQSGLEPLSPACCAVAAASTYIRSSANGSYQNPAYSWQLGSKMDGTHLSYG
jgi:hypothetical protein